MLYNHYKGDKMWFRKNKKEQKEKTEKNVKGTKTSQEKSSANKDKQDKKLSKNQEKVVEKDKKAKTEKTKKAIYRVVFSKENNVWQIKKDGAKRVIDSKVTKEEALERVKQLSESQEMKFVVHKKDGKFQKKSNLR